MTPDRPTWQAPKTDFNVVLEGGGNHTDSHDLETITPVVVRERLRTIFGDVQKANADWIDGRFETFRRESGNWGLDLMLVNAEGRLAAGPWSSYEMYLLGQGNVPVHDQVVSDLQIESMAELSAAAGQLLYPVAPHKDVTLMWHMSHANRVMPALRRLLNTSEIPIETLPFQLSVGATDPATLDDSFRRFALPGSIQMTRVPSGKVGSGKFAQQGVRFGHMGFWQSDRFGGYFPRVRFDETSDQPRTMISGFSEAGVLGMGGLPMDENHPNVKVLRTPNSRLTNLVERRDHSKLFVPAAFDAMMSSDPATPFVFRYRTYTPWTGNFPQHG